MQDRDTREFCLIKFQTFVDGQLVSTRGKRDSALDYQTSVLETVTDETGTERMLLFSKPDRLLTPIWDLTDLHRVQRQYSGSRPNGNDHDPEREMQAWRTGRIKITLSRNAGFWSMGARWRRWSTLVSRMMSRRR